MFVVGREAGGWEVGGCGDRVLQKKFDFVISEVFGESLGKISYSHNRVSPSLD